MVSSPTGLAVATDEESPRGVTTRNSGGLVLDASTDDLCDCVSVKDSGFDTPKEAPFMSGVIGGGV